MRLIDQLTKKRDEHLAAAGKYQELINFISGDEDVIKNGHTSKQNIVAKAMKLHAANGNGNGNGNGVHGAKLGRKRPMSAAERKAVGDRIRKLWKTKRSMMLRASSKGRKTVLRNKAAQAEASAN